MITDRIAHIEPYSLVLHVFGSYHSSLQEKPTLAYSQITF